jgi:hypothetical protein
MSKQAGARDNSGVITPRVARARTQNEDSATFDPDTEVALEIRDQTPRRRYRHPEDDRRRAESAY